VKAALILMLALCASVHAREYFITTTGGKSMAPALPEERVPVLVERAPFAELQAGDVVIYSHSRLGLTTHRLMEKVRGGWWPRGDGNRLADDELVTPENLVGRVVGVIPFEPIPPKAKHRQVTKTK
jgi:signal peptidase I